MRIIQIGLLGSISLLSNMAQSEDVIKGKWQPGFSGNATFLVGAVESNSQENSGNDTIYSINEKGKKKTDIFFFPIAASNLSYTFSNGNQRILLGTNNADIALGRPHVEVGYKQYVDDIGTLGVSYIPGVVPATTWEDPFLVGEKRQETDQKIHGFRFQYNDILDTHFGLEVSIGQKELDTETSGSQYSPEIQEQLNRNGDIYYTELSHLDPLSESLFLRSSASFLRQNLDGDAMSSDTYTAQLAFLKQFKRSTFTLSVKYKYSNFDGIHPLFLSSREDNFIGLFSTYVYKNAFGVKGMGLALGAGYSYNASNLDFYIDESVLLSTGVSYSF